MVTISRDNVSKCFSNVSISSSPNKHQNQVKLVKEKLSPYIESQIYCYFFKVSYGKWKLTQNLSQIQRYIFDQNK